MNILITGLGALGTVFAAFLKKAGHRVHALTKDKYLDALRDRKVRVAGIWGEHEAVLAGMYGSVDPLKSVPLDLIILTVKSYDTTAAIRPVKPLVGETTLVMVAQNGYPSWQGISRTVPRITRASHYWLPSRRLVRTRISSRWSS